MGARERAKPAWTPLSLTQPMPDLVLSVTSAFEGSSPWCRATAAACGRAKVARGPGVVMELRGLFFRTAEADSRGTSPEGPSDEDLRTWQAQVAKAISKGISRYLRMAGPGDVVRAHLSGCLMAMRKPSSKLRHLACDSVLRRQPAKSVCLAMAQSSAPLEGSASMALAGRRERKSCTRC